MSQISSTPTVVPASGSSPLLRFVLAVALNMIAVPALVITLLGLISGDLGSGLYWTLSAALLPIFIATLASVALLLANRNETAPTLRRDLLESTALWLFLGLMAAVWLHYEDGLNLLEGIVFHGGGGVLAGIVTALVCRIVDRRTW